MMIFHRPRLLKLLINLQGHTGKGDKKAPKGRSTNLSSEDEILPKPRGSSYEA